MAVVIADSDVLIDFLRGADPMASRVATELGMGALGTTVVNAFELWAGAHTPKQQRAVEELLEATEILPLDPAAARAGGDIHRDLRGRGITIGMADCLVAGICATRRVILLSRNTKHFREVKGLSLSGSWQEQP